MISIISATSDMKGEVDLGRCGQGHIRILPVHHVGHLFAKFGMADDGSASTGLIRLWQVVSRKTGFQAFAQHGLFFGILT